MKSLIVIILLSMLGVQTYAGPAKSFEKKINKIVKKDLGISAFEKESLLDNSGFGKLNFYPESLDVLKANGAEYYFVVQKAKGRFDHFYFVVFLEKDLRVKLVRVIKYDGEHGSEISHKRWLAQFIGKTPSDHLVFQKNIDAISGATISGRSITEQINILLKKLEEMKKQNLL